MDGNAWFRPKLFGWGATPIAWQGWALTAGYLALLAADLKLVAPPTVRTALAIGLTAALIAISWAKTSGGWRWRWGGQG